MLIERTSAHASTSEAQHYRPAVVAGRGEELAPRADRGPSRIHTMLRARSAEKRRMARASSRIRFSFERGSSATIESSSIRIEAPNCSARKWRKLIGNRLPSCNRCSLERRWLDRQAASGTRERPRAVEY